MPSISFDTSTANRLRSPSRSLPSASRALFPHRSPRSRHRSRSMWRFEASPRRATSKGQPSSPTQHHISKLRLHRTPLCVRDTHPHLTHNLRLFLIAHHDGLQSGGRRESHPPAPTDPYVNLSIHTALVILITRRRGRRWSRPSARRTAGTPRRPAATPAGHRVVP